MSEIITKGYLLNVVDYEIFDQIITFINEHGNIFSCIALGVKKIKSKNARHLKFGSFLEFNFFMGKTFDKVGKLKKVVSLDNVEYKIATNNALILLNQLYFKAKPIGVNFYNFYQEMLGLILKDYDQDLIIIKSLLEFIFKSGVSLTIEHCVFCKSKKIVNFDEANMGFVCKDHNNSQLNISINVIKLIYATKFIDIKKIENLFNEKDKQITIKFLIYLINSYLGINLYSLLLY